MLLLLLKLAGCGGDVVFDAEEEAPSSPAAAARDPEGTCAYYLARKDQVDDCRDVWGEVSCERRLRNAVDRGCVELTLEWFECYANACAGRGEDCDPIGEPMLSCLREEDPSSTAVTTDAATTTGGDASTSGGGSSP